LPSITLSDQFMLGLPVVPCREGAGNELAAGPCV
jgi:hypothetical protein